eukprot:9285081-Pyramimonas_sp.AAC.1
MAGGHTGYLALSLSIEVHVITGYKPTSLTFSLTELCRSFHKNYMCAYINQAYLSQSKPQTRRVHRTLPSRNRDASAMMHA